LDFCYNIIKRSGLAANGTYLPKGRPLRSHLHWRLLAHTYKQIFRQLLMTGPNVCVVCDMRPAVPAVYLAAAAIHPKYNCIEPKTSMDDAMVEARMVMFGAVEGLLKRQGLAPKDVDILVTTCSIFCPTPSLASLVVNHFGMRPDVQSYHLGGMGCSNGVVAVNLVKDLLRVCVHAWARERARDNAQQAHHLRHTADDGSRPQKVAASSRDT
jgi:hypothetical protein